MRAVVRQAFRLAVAALGIVGWAGAAHAVAVSPAVVIIDARTREGVVTLLNSGSHPEEVSLEFAWGYPQSDAQGRISVPLSKEARPGEPSAVAWMRVFPRRLVVGPGETQTVRILVRPPAGVPDGEYWARLVVSALPSVPPVERAEGAVQASVVIGSRVVVGVQYRVGRLATGVQVRGAAAERDSAGAVLTLDLERTGQAAYLGTVKVDAVDADGKVLASERTELSVFRTLRYKVRVPLPGGGSERAVMLRYALLAERGDLGGHGVLPAAGAAGSAPLPPGPDRR